MTAAISIEGLLEAVPDVGETTSQLPPFVVDTTAVNGVLPLPVTVRNCGLIDEIAPGVPLNAKLAGDTQTAVEHWAIAVSAQPTNTKKARAVKGSRFLRVFNAVFKATSRSRQDSGISKCTVPAICVNKR